ncbi:GAF and ANTAR domain-containing protein [Streptacidiphilus sp. N1-3]|uniref:GAF and ANTAR domain-containing protein n=1 Tax=Streptacidiphilus alkalitolerans TaxID=3342712 RepID=A0ABV6XBA4_9ACTN
MSGRSEMVVAALWARTALRLHAHDGVPETLGAVVDLVGSVVKGIDHAGVTVLRAPGVIDSAAGSDPLVRRLDRLQQDANEGPCLEAMSGQDLVRTDYLAGDRRWPVFRGEAVALGIGSILSCRISTGDGPATALNLHAERPYAFDDEAVQTAAIYAVHAGLALAGAERVAQERGGRGSQPWIGEAVGILMERHTINSLQAHDLLFDAAQRLDVRVRDIATHVVETGQEPASIRPHHLRGV